MTDIAPIVFSSTSSGPNGWSSLSKFLGCPARAHVDRNRAIERGSLPYDLFAEEPGKPVATTVGSLYGELTQRYLRGAPASPRGEFFWRGPDGAKSMEKSHPETCKQARLCYEDYTKKYSGGPPKHLGRIVTTEMQIVIPESVFGLEITGAIDLVVENDKGLGIWDLKTEGRNDVELKLKFGLRGQKWIYALGYELATGQKPTHCGIDICIKNKEPKYDYFEYEGLTDKRFEWLQGLVNQVKDGMKTGEKRPCMENCRRFSRTCEHLYEGLCVL